MTELTRTPATTVRAMVGGLAAVYAATFFAGAVLHLGVAIPLGPVTLTEPVILPATIVESLCGLALAIAAYATLTRKPWAWNAVVGGHAVALGGVLLGVTAITLNGGPSTPLNDTYHRVMIVLLAAGLIWLRTQAARTALGRGG
jgi:hypothetical protein